MGKTKRSDKEFTREQRLIDENRVLKRQVSALRKELARVDLDQFTSLKDTIGRHYKEGETQQGLDILEKVKQEWRCNECKEGYLEIFIYSKVGNLCYFRKCSNPSCKHRTKSQRYNPNEVKGIIKDSK